LAHGALDEGAAAERRRVQAMTAAQLIHRARERLFSAADVLLLQAEKVLLSFKAENDDLAKIRSCYAKRGLHPPSWLGVPLDTEALQAEADPELLKDQETLSDEEWDAKYSNAAPSEPALPS
jgi:hypothetical protein